MPPGGPLTVHHTGTPKAAVVPGATTLTIADQPLLCAQHQAKHFLAIIPLSLTTTPFER